MAAIGKVSIELEAKIAKLETDVGRAARIMEREFAKMRTQVSGHLQGIEKRADETGKVLKRVFNIGVAVQLAHDLRMLADNFANLSARVKLASGANANFGASLGAVKRVAMDTYASLTATAGLVQKISQSLQNTGMSASNSFSNAIKLTETFNKALVVSGAGTIQAEAAMLQFSQAIAKGKLDGDEFRSVMENNSRFMLLLADSLGVTFKELYKMREQGKLTSDMIMKVTENTKLLDAEFATFPLTIGRAFTNLNSAMTTFVGGMDNATGTSRALANSIAFLAENLDTIGSYAITGGSIYLLAGAFDMVGKKAADAGKQVVSAFAASSAQKEMLAASAAMAQASLVVAEAKTVEIAKTLAVIDVARKEEVAKMGAAGAAMRASEVAVAAANAEVVAAERVMAANAMVFKQRLDLAKQANGIVARPMADALNSQIIKQEIKDRAVLDSAINKEIASRMALRAESTAYSSAVKNLAVLGQQESRVRMELAGATTAQMLAQMKASGATESLAKSTTLMSSAMTAAKGAASGLFAILGGWPGVIAAAVIATVMWASAESDYEEAARNTESALQDLISATNALEKARAMPALESAYATQADELAKLKVTTEENIAALERFNTVNGLASSDDMAQAVANLNDKLAKSQSEFEKTTASILEFKGVDVNGYLALVSSTVTSLIDPLHGAKRAMDLLSSAGMQYGTSAEEFTKYLNKQKETLGENNAELRGGARALIAYKFAQVDFNKLNSEAKKEMLANIAAVVKLTDENEALTKGKKEGVKAEKEFIKAERDAAKALDERWLATIRNGAAARKMAAEADPIAAATEEYALAVEKLNRQLFAGELLYINYQDALGGLKRTMDDTITRVEDTIRVRARESDIVGRAIEDMDREAASIGLVGRAAFVFEEITRRTAEAQDLFNRKLRDTPYLLDGEKEAISGAAAALYDHGIAAANAASIMEDYENTMIGVGHSVSDAFGTLFSDIIKGNEDITSSFENLGDALVDIIADSVGQMISEFFKLQIINPMLNQMFSGFGGNLLPTAGGGGMFGGIGQMFGGGGGGIMGMLGGLFGGGATGTGVMSAAGAAASANLGSVGLGLYGSGGALSGMSATSAAAGGGLLSGSGIGTAFAGVPIIGWIAAAMAMNMSLFSQGWRPQGGSLVLPNGQSVSGGGSSIGRGLDSLVNLGGILPFGDRISSLLSGSAVVTRLFGRRAPELTGSTSNYTFGAGGVGGSESYNTLERGGVFRSDRRRTRNFALSDDSMAQAQQIFDELSAVVRDAAARLRAEAPDLIDSALRIVQEFDKDGKVKSTKYFVDAIGRTWEEATSEAAMTRLSAENIIATIDSIMGSVTAAAVETITGSSEEIVGAVGDAGTDAFSDLIRKAEYTQGEASAIAERWRDDAETLMDGATFLLLAAEDIRDGVGLLGEGSLTQITDLIEDLQVAGESLSDTYARVAMATALFEEALDLSGVTVDLTREAFVRFATDIADAAGGIERAQALWSAYFDSFYSDSERAARASGVARTNATREFGDIGLDVKPFMDEGGAAAFRAMFEELLPTLSADAIVQWLEAANALGILIDATATLGEVTDGTAQQMREALSALMSDVDDEIVSLSPPASFAERMQAITQETARLIIEAEALGGGEKEFTRIRELGLLRQNALIEEQTQLLAAQEAASAGLRELLSTLAAESTMSGISPLTQSLMSLRAEYQQHIDRINELAIASGRAGASQEELAVATGWYAAQLKKIARELMQSGLSLVQQLYGATGATSGGTGTGGGSSGWGGTPGDIGDVTAAVEDRYAKEMELLKNLGEYLDSLGLSSLSPLTPQEQLQEAQQQYQDLLARAMGGDLEALGQLQGAANTYLGQAQSYYGGVGAYGGIFDDVQAQIQALLDRGPLNSPAEAPPTVVTGPGGGGIVVEPGTGFNELSLAERAAIANELTTVLHDLIALTGQSLIEVSSQLGLDLRDLVRDLGVNLDDLTVATTVQLADISRQLGVDLTELASGVGVSLGSLADEQSLMNDALEQTINGLPVEFRDHLREYLTAIEDATTEADANEAIAAAEAAINLLPADIRDLLAPFFEGVSSPTDDLLDYAMQQLAATTSSRDLLADILTALGSIDTHLGALGPGGGFGGPVIGPLPPAPDAIAAAAMSVIAATVDEASAESDVVGNAKPSDMLEALRAIKEELASVKAAVTGSGNKTAENVGRVESAVKSLNVGKRNG